MLSRSPFSTIAAADFGQKVVRFRVLAAAGREGEFTQPGIRLFWHVFGRYHTTRKEENEEIENLNVNGNVIRKVNI